MRSSKEQQEEIRKPSSMTNVKKQRKAIGWERQKTLGKTRQENWRYQGNISCKDGRNKGKKQKNLTEAEEIKKRWARIHKRTI